MRIKLLKDIGLHKAGTELDVDSTIVMNLIKDKQAILIGVSKEETKNGLIDDEVENAKEYIKATEISEITYTEMQKLVALLGLPKEGTKKDDLIKSLTDYKAKQ